MLHVHAIMVNMQLSRIFSVPRELGSGVQPTLVVFVIAEDVETTANEERSIGTSRVDIVQVFYCNQDVVVIE